MSIVLAIESSTANCAVSIQGAGIDYHKTEFAPQQHAKLMLPMIQQALADTALQPSQLDALAFGEGPGAFTGLRIAAGVIQGLAFGWHKPVVAISSLEALAYQAFEFSGQTQWVACLDARMGEVYTQQVVFNSLGECVSASTPSLLAQTQVLDLLRGAHGVGDITQAYPSLVAQADYWLDACPHARSVARLALQRLNQACLISQAVPQPVYLRASVT
ncbi:MAG: tRNA (adenosine(37)-N6)-threonylcarbamoyltransferase complex dimerization subunit type 1 TsaB [Thiomicrospira sp.]|jgi:tRNA threonylcarbamoyladenosine biosynthesis protein TsaB